jgi:hypothetical protein
MAADTEPLRHQVIDLPPMKPTADEFRLHRTTCGQPPVGTSALVGLPTASCHLIRRKVQGLS